MEYTIRITRNDLYTLIYSLTYRKNHLERSIRKENISFPVNSKKVNYLLDSLSDLNYILNILQDEWIGGELDEA